jgi:hypothetical protein
LIRRSKPAWRTSANGFLTYHLDGKDSSSTSRDPMA